MVVALTWSASQGGSAISTPLNWSSISVGANSTDDLYLRHDGAEKIYDCSFYITAYTGSYVGGATAGDDYTELLTWGDGGDGFAINQDNTNSFPVGSWQIHTSASGIVGTPIALDGDSRIGGAGTNGEINTGDEHRIKVRISVPSDELTPGTRMFDQVLNFTYTS